MTYKVYFQQLILRPETYLIKIVKEAYIEVTELASKYRLDFNHNYGYNSISQTYLLELLQELTINDIAYKIQDFSDDESKHNFVTELTPIHDHDLTYGNINFLYEESILETKKRHEALEAYLKAKDLDTYHQSSTPAESFSYFDMLSTEIMAGIFRSIPEDEFRESYASLQQVCQRWYHILNDTHIKVLYLKKNLLVNANCQENTSKWLVTDDLVVYTQENIEEIFSNYYDPQYDLAIRFNRSTYDVINKIFRNSDKINRYFFTKMRSIEYLEKFNIHEIFNKYTTHGDFFSKMQIIDLYKYTKELILILHRIKGKIFYTELFIGDIIVNIHLLDENKVIISSFKQEFSSEIWTKLNKIIEITQPFRYILFDHGSTSELSVKNTCISITCY